jgi:hypothetical protein
MVTGSEKKLLRWAARLATSQPVAFKRTLAIAVFGTIIEVIRNLIQLINLTKLSEVSYYN